MMKSLKAVNENIKKVKVIFRFEILISRKHIYISVL